LDTEVIDVELIDVPDPRCATSDVASRLLKAFKSMCKRDIGRMAEEALIDCHTYERAPFTLTVTQDLIAHLILSARAALFDAER
jgi:hypothetical protein